MKLVFGKAIENLMFFFEVEMLLRERLPRDLATLIMSFLKEDPRPWCWPIEPQPSPWDPLVEVDACAGVGLPLFAP